MAPEPWAVQKEAQSPCVAQAKGPEPVVHQKDLQEKEKQK
jgi:hypothetical protein